MGGWPDPESGFMDQPPRAITRMLVFETGAERFRFRPTFWRDKCIFWSQSLVRAILNHTELQGPI